MARGADQSGVEHLGNACSGQLGKEELIFGSGAYSEGEAVMMPETTENLQRKCTRASPAEGAIKAGPKEAKREGADPPVILLKKHLRKAGVVGRR